MGQDRFIRWPDDAERPSVEELERCLARYINQSGTVKRDGVWLTATLIGEPCQVWLPELDDQEWETGGCKNGERWFEMFCDPKSTYSVITRHADQFTNALADGWTRLVAIHWKGKWENV